jgi:DNA repair exonuclease SbcCD ATPase subunit
MLSINKLEWGGCFSYGDNNSIDLNSSTITQLIGENGSGKSSIPLILQEVFFNKNSKGVKKADIANRNLPDGSYWINAFFSLDETDYSIQLKRASTVKVKLYKGDEDISSHTATETFKTIESLVGVDFKIFVQLIYQSITDGLSFLTATDTVRKKFLIDLFNLDEYSKYFELFKAVVQETTKDISSCNGSIAALEKIIRKSDDIGDYLDHHPLPVYPEYPSQVGALEAQIADIVKINKRISNNEQLKKLLKNIVVDHGTLGMAQVDVSSLNSDLGEIKGKINSLHLFINKMKKLSDTCPTCGQGIEISKEKALKAEAETELQELLAKQESMDKLLKQWVSTNTAIDKALKARDERDDLLQRIDNTLASSPLVADELEDQISELKSAYNKQLKAYKEVEKLNQDIEQHNHRITLLKQQRQETLEELNGETQLLQELTKRLSIFEVLKKTFSTNGLVAYKLENLVKDIEEAANVYLLELSDGRFSLVFSISGDKLNVSLVDGVADIDISALSSGELARVNTATLLAIRKIMSSISKTQINILFLDEVINVLDDYGRERLIEVLLEEKALNTFLVSHSWTHPLLDKINIVKVDGISQLKEQ